MAPALYPTFKALILTAGIDLESDSNVKAALMDTGTYTYSAAHDFWNDASAGVVGTPVALTGRTINSPTPGVFDATDTIIVSVSGATVEAVIIWKDTGTPTTSDLVCFVDGLSVTPNGGNITIQWDSGANRIFSL